MRFVEFVADLGEFKSGEVLEVEEQIATDAIAQGFAIPAEYSEKHPDFVNGIEQDAAEGATVTEQE